MSASTNATLAAEALDWNLLWREAMARKDEAADTRTRSDYWDRRAPSFASRCHETPYTRTFLDVLGAEPHWSVLDVGCGAGTLAIPLGSRVQSITAMDFSEAMLEQLVLRRDELGLSNIRTLHGGWDDDWDALGVGAHDVVIASRSLMVGDLETALRKLDRASRLGVYLTAPAGYGPSDRRALEAVGRPSRKGPDYIYVYNLLYQMGIFANITLIRSEEGRPFAGPDEALGFYRTLIDGLSPEEDQRLQAYLQRELRLRDGKWYLRHQDAIQWALIWWRKNG